MIFFGLGVAVGWNNDEDMERSATTAGAILMTYYVLKLNSGIHDFYLAPFKSSICVMGANYMFLAMLIMSSKYHKRGQRYFNMNMLMLVLMFQALAMGTIYSMEGLRNTTLIYLLLWGIEKYYELYFNMTQNAWGFMFSMSALVYYLALEINKHPEFVVSLFKSNQF